MKKFFLVCLQGIRNLSIVKQFGLISLTGALAGIPMLKVPEFVDGFGILAIVMLGVIGIICLEFGDFILPSKPTPKLPRTER